MRRLAFSLAVVASLALPATPLAAQPVERFSEMVKGDNVEAVRAYLDAGGDANAVEGSRNLTLMHWAAFHGASGVVRLLAEKGAAVDARATKPDWRPLHYAAYRGHGAIVSYLLDRGAAVNGMTDDGMTALSVYEARPEMVRLLLSRNADPGHALAYMVRKNWTNAVAVLLDTGVNVDSTPRADALQVGIERGVTPLFLAVEAGHFELASLLLNRGANPNVSTPKPVNMPTPLSVAAYHCDEAMIDLLLGHGASRTATNGGGDTAADLAESGWTTEMQPCSPQIVAKLR